MGGGSWTSASYLAYSDSRGLKLDADGSVSKSVLRGKSAQDVYQSRSIDPALNPLNVTRECLDTEEHPLTKPVILAIDVTGSMGQAAIEVARVLNPLMTELYQELKDVEFCVMGIGDLAYDYAPIQMSQFESDIRIAEQLDKIWFEGGGGGNDYESYTAVWYMGLNHAKLDAYDKRGQKGLIITLGDEPLNPYLPSQPLSRATGDTFQADVETSTLYPDVARKFNIFHIQVEHGESSSRRTEGNVSSFAKFIGADNVKVSNIDSLKDTLKGIILSSFSGESPSSADGNGYISW